MKQPQTIDFGVKVKDLLTGFTGRVTAFSRSASGPNQYAVIAESKEGAAPTTMWFDEPRLETLGDAMISFRK